MPPNWNMVVHMDASKARIKAVAATLRAERAAAGFNQKALAEKAGIPIATYFRYERGDRSISAAQAIQVCEALGITFTQFAQQVEQRLAQRGRVVLGPWGEVPDWADAIAARDVDE